MSIGCSFSSDRYSFPFTFCFTTFFSPSMILCRTSTILFLSMSVFLLVNFLTKSLDVMGLRIRYLFTSSSDIELVEMSVFCFFSGGRLAAAVLPSGVADRLLLFTSLASGVPLSRFLECLLLLEECFFFFPAGEPLPEAVQARKQDWSQLVKPEWRPRFGTNHFVRDFGTILYWGYLEEGDYLLFLCQEVYPLRSILYRLYLQGI